MFALRGLLRIASCRRRAFPSTSTSLIKPKPWGRAVDKVSFNQDYPTEFRPSGVLVDGAPAGNGWWAKVDIPKGTVLRRVSVDEGSMVRISSLEELCATGWDIDDTVNYGIGHKQEPNSIMFLSPGTACNHADPTREISIQYLHDEFGVFKLVTTKDVKAEDEMFISYSRDFSACKWYDDMHAERGNIPLSKLGDIINAAGNKAAE